MKKIPLLLYLIFIICILACFYSCESAKKNRSSDTEAEIKKIYDMFSIAIKEKNLDAVMSMYVPGERLVAFDAFPPRQYKGVPAYRKDYENFFAAFPGPATSEISDIHVISSDTLACAYGIDKWIVTGTDGKPIEMVFRFTDVFQKINGKLLVIHEHLSVPVDPMTGMADFLSKP